MRLCEFFYDNEDSTDNEQEPGTIQRIHENIDARERNKIWMPPSGRDPSLDMYIEMVKEDVIDGISRNNRDNLNEEERQALRDLSKDDTIVIRPADKGSGVVIMNK